mgnify:CR=1 FL=1
MTGRIVRVSGLELQLRRTGRGRVEISYRGRVLGVVEEDRSVHVASSGGARVRPASAKPAPPNARHARRNGGPRRRRSRPYGWTCWRGGPSWTTCEVAYGCTLRKAVASLLRAVAADDDARSQESLAPRRADPGHWHQHQCVACALDSHTWRFAPWHVSGRLRRIASLPNPHRKTRR